MKLEAKVDDGVQMEMFNHSAIEPSSCTMIDSTDQERASVKTLCVRGL